MPPHSRFLGECSYVGHNGTCGRRCFREVCSIHYGKKSMPLCKHCGKKGTLTPHGFCTAVETGCRWKSHYASRLIIKAKLRGTRALATSVCADGPVSTEGVMKRVVGEFVDRMVGGACLIASAAFIHLLGRGDMIQGYLGRGGRCYCRHYWVRLDDVDYDVGSAIMAILAPHSWNTVLGEPELHHDPPSGMQMDDPGSLATLEHFYRAYQRDPSALLSSAPDWMHSAFNFPQPRLCPPL
jgi:hypothetical protein